MSEADRIKWNDRFARTPKWAVHSSPLLQVLEPLLGASGRALDIGGGTGRHALWVARQGFHTTLIDVSDQAIETARAAAAREHVALTTQRWDADSEPIPQGPWEVILCFYFLHRRLFEQAPTLLAPRGLLVVAHPTKRNLERHPRPSAPYMLEDGSLPGLLPTSLEVLHYEEGWLEEGKHEARLIARRRCSTAEQ